MSLLQNSRKSESDQFPRLLGFSFDGRVAFCLESNGMVSMLPMPESFAKVYRNQFSRPRLTSGNNHIHWAF